MNAQQTALFPGRFAVSPKQILVSRIHIDASPWIVYNRLIAKINYQICVLSAEQSYVSRSCKSQYMRIVRFAYPQLRYFFKFDFNQIVRDFSSSSRLLQDSQHSFEILDSEVFLSKFASIDDFHVIIFERTLMF